MTRAVPLPWLLLLLLLFPALSWGQAKQFPKLGDPCWECQEGIKEVYFQTTYRESYYGVFCTEKCMEIYLAREAANKKAREEAAAEALEQRNERKGGKIVGAVCWIVGLALVAGVGAVAYASRRKPSGPAPASSGSSFVPPPPQEYVPPVRRARPAQPKPGARVCPNCRSSYGPTVERCDTCRVPLVTWD